MARRLVPMFHHAGAPPPEARKTHLYVSAERLAGHVRAIARMGYRFETVTDSLDSKAERVACLTFDDGYVDNLEVALPVLEKLGVRATVYVVTGDIGRRGVAWAEERGATLPADVMGWAQLKRLRDAGWEIGSHAHDHRRLGKLPHEEQARLIAESTRALRDGLGAAPTSFAYPYGSYGAETIAIVKANGYRCAVTTKRGVDDGADPFQIRRIALGGHRWWHAAQVAKVWATARGVYPWRPEALVAE